MHTLPLDCRCRVIAKLSNGQYALIWWRYNFQPWMDGKKLLRHWSNQKAVGELIRRGGIVQLGNDIKTTEFEQGVKAETAGSYEDFIKRYGHNGFRYHWDGRQWYLQEHPLENYVRMKVPEAADQIALSF